MSSVLVAGAPADTADLARALTADGYRVIFAGTAGASDGEADGAVSWTSLGDDLVAAFGLDLPEGFDAEQWTSAVHEVSPTAPVAFAWARSGATGRDAQCRRWLARTARLRTDAADEANLSGARLAVELPGDARAASTARHVVRALVSSGDAAFHEAVALVTSELATNAALHGRPPIHLDAIASDKGVYVSVEDVGSGHLPRRRAAHRLEEAGRGLAIVAAVADWWGVTALPGRVVVWCDLTT